MKLSFLITPIPRLLQLYASQEPHRVIVDIDKDSMLIDYDEIEKAITPKTKAMIPVSLFGNPLITIY